MDNINFLSDFLVALGLVSDAKIRQAYSDKLNINFVEGKIVFNDKKKNFTIENATLLTGKKGCLSHLKNTLIAEINREKQVSK